MLSHKTKQYLLVALKVLILVGTSYYIFYKLNTTQTNVITTIYNSFYIKTTTLVYGSIYCIIFIIINWYFEILKWKTLVTSFKKISLLRATKESLAALTMSIATPNRIGEYGAKALFYPAGTRKKIVLLNLIGNGYQMLITTVLGIIGLVYLATQYHLGISWLTTFLLLVVFILLAVLAYLFKEKELLIRGFSIKNVITFYKNLGAKIKLHVLLFSIIRYVTFCVLSLSLLTFYGASVQVVPVFAALFSMYLLASLTPSLLILDVAVKGGIAVFLFSLIGVTEVPVLCTILSMWLLNMVIPAIVGSFYLFSIKTSSIK